MEIKTILVPTDFSPLAGQALTVAAEISRKTSAEITLLHVIESPHHQERFSSTGEVFQGSGINDVFILKSIERVHKYFREIMDDARYVGIRFHPLIRIGDIDRHLYTSVVKQHIDLIVMGTTGSTSLFKGIFNNSHTEEVVMHADCMVLTVKEHIKPFQIRNLIFATDFSDYSPAFIHKLQNLQDLFHFTFHLLYINASINPKNSIQMDAILHQKDQFLKRFKIRDYECHVVEDFSEYTGVMEYAEKINADMIAINTHQRKGFWHWMGGLSEDLVNYAKIPVLTFKAGKE